MTLQLVETCLNSTSWKM